MIKKKNRLSTRAFNRFFDSGKRHHSKHLQFVFSPYESFHASVVVPKKVARKAVARNKIRRRIYDMLRRYKTESGVSGVFILIAKSGVETLTYETLKAEVHSLLTKI